MPGSIVCFDHNQINLYKKWFNNQLISSQSYEKTTPCLYISYFQGNSSLVNTTINGKRLEFYEMCIRKYQSINLANDESQLIPLSFMLTTSPFNKTGLLQWLHSFFDSVKNNANETSQNKLNVICDISMPLVETLLSIFKNQSFARYSIECFKKCLKNFPYNNEEYTISDISLESLHKELETDFSVNFNDKVFLDGENLELVIHACTNQFMNEISILCNYYYRQNYSFGMYAFSCLVNSQSMFELEKCLYSIMCILYSKKLNTLVDSSFDFLKTRLNFYGAQNRNKIAKNSKIKSKTPIESPNEFYMFNNETVKQNSNQFDDNEENFGLRAFKKRPNTESNTFLLQLEDERLDKLNQNSIFFKLCEKLFIKIKILVDQCEKEEMAKNPRASHELLFYFLRQFSATLPLWMNKNVLFESCLPTTLKLHTERFIKLKYNNEQKQSVYTFIKRIYEENSLQVKSHLELYSKDERKLMKRKKCPSLLNSLISKETDIELIDDSLDNNSNESTVKYSNKNDIIRVKCGVLNDKSERNNSQKLCKKVKKIINKKSNQAQVEFETDFLLKTNIPSFQPPIYNDCNANVESNENNYVTSIVVLNNESNDLEQEIVIKRQRQILTNDFGLELTKDDIDSLDNLSLPNSNVSLK